MMRFATGESPTFRPTDRARSMQLPHVSRPTPGCGVQLVAYAGGDSDDRSRRGASSLARAVRDAQLSDRQGRGERPHGRARARQPERRGGGPPIASIS